MVDNRPVVDRLERLVRALSALDLRERAGTGYELVRACWSVAGLASPLADEAVREDICSPAKERAEQPHLFRGCFGNRPGQCRRRGGHRAGVIRQRRQLLPKLLESLLRPIPVLLERGKASLLLGDSRKQLVLALCHDPSFTMALTTAAKSLVDAERQS